jgi:hypothetical protein
MPSRQSSLMPANVDRAIRGGSEIIRGFADGQAGGRIAGCVEELKRRTPLSIR